MKTFNLIFTFFLSLFLIASCKKSTNALEIDILYGTWVKESKVEEITILKRAKELDDREYGFIICPDGKFIEHKNSGRCGTPPITFANYDGNWNYLADDSLKIDVGYWGGTISYILNIVSLEKDVLKVIYHCSN